MTDRPVVVRAATTPSAHRRLARLAHEIWHEHYPGIISAEQIEYMLARGYSPAALAADQAAGARFMLAWLDARAVGFAAVSPDRGGATAWLDKLYVHASARKRGVARALLQAALGHARDWPVAALGLRVNRHNAVAIAAYEQLGFTIEATDIKDIGHGYAMDDYLMVRALDAP